MSSSFTQLNDISEKRREAKERNRMTEEKFSEILCQCGFDERISEEEPFEILPIAYGADAQCPDFVVHLRSTIDTDQLAKLKILSGYDLKCIDTMQVCGSGVLLVFGKGYKKGAIKRIITGPKKTSSRMV